MPNITLFKKRQIWWMQYRLHGARIRKSLGTRVESIARRKAKVQEEKLLLQEGEDYRGRTKYEVFWEEYLIYARSVKRPKTVHNDKRIYHKFTAWMNQQGGKYLDQINEVRFEAYRIHLQQNHLQKSSINLEHRHLSSILSYAVRMGFLAGNPLKKIKKYKVENKPPRFLSKEEIQILLECAQSHSPQSHMIFGLGIYAGLRCSEIANARWEWFDFESHVIVIQPWGEFIPKSHRTRPIPLHRSLREILMHHRQNEGFILTSSVAEEERKNLIRYDFHKSFNSVTQQANLQWVTPHILRHTFASQLALVGVSLYKIQKWLGHSDPKTTMIYAHLQAQDEEINLI